MNRRTCALIVALTLLGAAPAHAQTPTRLRGTVAAVAGEVMTVKSADGMNMDVRVTDKTTLTYTQPIALADIKQGDFLAVTSRKRPDGSLVAVEVRRFPKPANPGHRPFEGRDDQTMTNASVSATVQSTNRRELLMSYDGGSQKITVPENAAISMLVPASRAQIVPGMLVSVNAVAEGGGKLGAKSVQLSKPRPMQ